MKNPIAALMLCLLLASCASVAVQQGAATAFATTGAILNLKSIAQWLFSKQDEEEIPDDKND